MRWYNISIPDSEVSLNSEMGTELERERIAPAGATATGGDRDAAQPGSSLAVDAKELLVRLWRAAAPTDERDERRSEEAAKRHIETRRNESPPTVLFDPEYYTSQLPWFVRDELDPLEHYLATGWTMGLSPHALFDSAHVARQLGIRSWTEPPLLAYFEHEREVSAHPLFSVDVYARNISLSGRRSARLFEVFVGSWDSACAPFSELFSLFFYEKFEPVARHGAVNPLRHYLMTDPGRRRDPNPMIHNRWYDLNYPAGRGQPVDPLIRFATVGLNQGHLPNPFAARELRLRNPESSLQRDMLLRYVDVTALDRDWLSARVSGAPEIVNHSNARRAVEAVGQQQSDSGAQRSLARRRSAAEEPSSANPVAAA